MIEQFEQHRSFLFSLAYRMLGTVSDAEDILQDAFLRVHDLADESIRKPKSFLATTVTRLCLNRLSAAKTQRAQYLGPWLPEPIVTDDPPTHHNPVQQTETFDSLSIAFLVLLETLSPAERAVFLLHDVFDYKHQEIAEMLDKTVPACRQLLRRAKQHIAAERPRFDPNPAHHERLLRSFIEVAELGEIDKFLQLLAEDVTLVPDGGGERGAAIRVLQGQEAVIAFMAGSNRLAPDGMQFSVESLNGQRAIVARYPDHRPFFVIFVYAEGNVISLMHIIAGQKLKHLSGIRLGG